MKLLKTAFFTDIDQAADGYAQAPDGTAIFFNLKYIGVRDRFQRR